MTLPYDDEHSLSHATPLTVENKATIMTSIALEQLLSNYEEIVSDLIDLMQQENEQIQTYKLNLDQHLRNKTLLEKKQNQADALESILAKIYQCIEENQLSSTQVQHIHTIYQKFCTTLEENLAYLELAEALNNHMLNFFVEAHSELNRHVYNATGTECALPSSQGSTFLFESA